MKVYGRDFTASGFYGVKVSRQRFYGVKVLRRPLAVPEPNRRELHSARFYLSTPDQGV